MTNSLNIPVAIMKYALTNSCVNQLGTYCFLKMNCDGHFSELKEMVSIFKTETGRTERTFFNHLKWLEDSGWILKLNRGYRVISFKKLIEKLQINKYAKRGAIFTGDFMHFRGFICAAFITYVGKVKRYKDKRTGTKLKGSASNRLVNSFNLPHLYLAKILSVAKSTAQHYRKYADLYLDIYQEYHSFDMKPEDVKHFRNHCDDSANIVIRNGKVYEQRPTRMQSAITLKRCRL